MSGRKKNGRYPWSVPVAQSEVPEAGRHFELIADESVRAATARMAGLTAMPRLTASFDVSRHGRSGLRVDGRVSATVGQTCGVSLEPIENEIEEAIELVFVSAPPGGIPEPDWGEIEVPLEDAPDILSDGTVDLGAIATEFLILGIDPYPRKSGSEFASAIAAEDKAKPFAALAVLKKPGPGI
jgi:hypothetical protein